MVAEPLQFHAKRESDVWLQNYRSHLRRILGGSFSTVEFLPEPFAVFTYFRYGKRHSQLRPSKKYVALVIDFGGGTFDTSLIETTQKGDVARSGRHSRPFAASSEQIGGVFIDQLIAEQCMMKALPDTETKKRLRTRFNKQANYTADIVDDLSEANRAAYWWTQRVQQGAETAKIYLCDLIEDWELDGAPTERVSVSVPSNPFDANSATVEIDFSAHEFKDIFVGRIWKEKIHGAVKAAFRRAEEVLQGKQVNLLLLSGGSCNIGWLQKLISEDFSEFLSNAETAPMAANFQEVVSQGLAVECARRHLLAGASESYSGIDAPKLAPQRADEDRRDHDAAPTEPSRDAAAPAEQPLEPDPKVAENIESETDFQAVTYNNLYLSIQPDDSEETHVRLKPWGETRDRLDEESAGVLFSSGTSLSRWVNRKLTWEVKLPRAPMHSLTYHFSRSPTLPPEPLDLYNIDDKVYTQGFKQFGSSIWLELEIREDGTCVPEFVYKRDHHGKPIEERKGVPFAIDSTDLLNARNEPAREHATTVLPEEGNEQLAHEQAGTHSAPPTAETVAKHADEPPRHVPKSNKSAFFGFDFGTTNSSVSYISQRSMELTSIRHSDPDWGTLSECADTLPTAVAYSAKEFLQARDESLEAKNALALMEASYAFLAYLAYSEVRVLAPRKSKLFKGFTQRSIGPLQHFLGLALDALGGRATLCAPIVMHKRKLIDEQASVIDELNEVKHEKRSSLSHSAMLSCENIGALVSHLMEGKAFGYFREHDYDPFSQQAHGQFRIATGRPPFHRTLRYQATKQFASRMPYVVDIKSGEIRCLAPLMLWESNALRDEDILVFDGGNTKEGWQFKYAMQAGSKTITPESEPGTVDVLDRLKENDQPHAADTKETVTFYADDEETF